MTTQARETQDEVDELRKQIQLLTLQVITCEVAATHPDANLSCTGTYAEEWNSNQAESVRKLRAQRDELLLLIKEWMVTELDAQDEEYEPWLEQFTARCYAAIARCNP